MTGDARPPVHANVGTKPDLPAPEDRSGTDVVIYDGNCPFCWQQVRRLQRWDRGGRLSFLSLHDPRVAQAWPDLSYDRLMQEMVIVDQRGRRHAGAAAVRYLTRRLPRLWPLAPLMHFPGTLGLWGWFYRQISRRRYGLVSWGGSCREGVCRRHDR